jgi:hypothetical protein
MHDCGRSCKITLVLYDTMKTTLINYDLRSLERNVFLFNVRPTMFSKCAVILTLSIFY